MNLIPVVRLDLLSRHALVEAVQREMTKVSESVPLGPALAVEVDLFIRYRRFLSICIALVAVGSRLDVVALLLHAFFDAFASGDVCTTRLAPDLVLECFAMEERLREKERDTSHPPQAREEARCSPPHSP
jgi:hypothetical protein